MQPFTGVPVVMGHRGAPRHAAANTPESFAAAGRAGATWVELDVRRSADDHLVVHHDPHTPDGVALVERSARALADRWGVWPLEAVLDGLPPGLGVDVEVKNLPGQPDFDDAERAARALAVALRPHVGARPVMTSSFSPPTVAVLAAERPEIPAGLLHTAGLDPGEARALAVEQQARVLCPSADSGLDERAVRAAHDAGLAVLVWTVDAVPEARRLAAIGVDAICTNDPAALCAGLGRA